MHAEIRQEHMQDMATAARVGYHADARTWLAFFSHKAGKQAGKPDTAAIKTLAKMRRRGRKK